MTTSAQSVKILIIDDEAAICGVLSASLRDEGYQVTTAPDGAAGLELMSTFRPDVVLLDIWMPGEFDGLDVLRMAKPSFPSTQFIMMSGHGTIETAVKSTKLGAWDFVEKPLSLDKISILISNIISYQNERSEKIALLNKLRRNIALVGDSATMKDLKQLVARVSPSQSSILITGENGSGKELLAQNIHYLSGRASRPFIDVSCAAIPIELQESELFGFEKGAFVGAEKSKKGKVDYAQGGSLFLNEITELSPSAQLQLSRLLQDKKFHRLGGVDTIDSDVRIIASTTKDIEGEMRAGRFNTALYDRLKVITVQMPTLRERREDIVALVSHFGEQFVREGGYSKKIFSDRALARLNAYPWPANVRELRNFVERIYILIPGDFIDVMDLKFAGLPTEGVFNAATDSTFRGARAEFEKEFLLQKISENGGNISKTAEAIGLERSYLHRKIKAYGIEAH